MSKGRTQSEALEAGMVQVRRRQRLKRGVPCQLCRPQGGGSPGPATAPDPKESSITGQPGSPALCSECPSLPSPLRQRLSRLSWELTASAASMVTALGKRGPGRGNRAVWPCCVRRAWCSRGRRQPARRDRRRLHRPGPKDRTPSFSLGSTGLWEEAP